MFNNFLKFNTQELEQPTARAFLTILTVVSGREEHSEAKVTPIFT